MCPSRITDAQAAFPLGGYLFVFTHAYIFFHLVMCVLFLPGNSCCSPFKGWQPTIFYMMHVLKKKKHFRPSVHVLPLCY